MTTYGIRTIAEQSMAAWFATNASMLPGVQVNIGQTGEIRSIPSVILYAEGADAHPNFGSRPLGNFELSLKIYIYSSADDAPTEVEALNLHRGRVEAVQAIMQDLAGLKAAWTQGKLYHAWLRSDEEGVSDRRYGNVLTYTAVAVYPPA
jgi:hypothetical protein